MKPYGVPRDKELDCPDVQTIKKYGLKTSVGGRDYFKNKKSKASSRRIWKKKARKEGKFIEEYNNFCDVCGFDNDDLELFHNDGKCFNCNLYLQEDWECWKCWW